MRPTSGRIRRGRVALIAAVVGAACFALTAEPAAASVEGPCTATIAGQNVADLSTGATSDAVDVRKGTNVVVAMNGRLMTHLKLTISFAGFEWTVKDEAIDAGAWAEAVPVDDYAKYGKGLYLVKGVSSGDGFSCTGAALVNVKGNPLSSVAGVVGLAMAILGVAGLGAVGVATYRAAARPKRSIEAWTADQLETVAAADGSGDAPTPPPRDERTMVDQIDDAVAASSGGGTGTPGGSALQRAHWRPKLSLVGMLSGVIAAVGIGALLQQYAVVYPTRSVVVLYLAVGLLAGVAVPSLARLFAVLGVNRAVADAEQALAARP